MQLLEAIVRAQSRFITHADASEVFNGLLDDILLITGSEYGFIGEVLRREDGAPYLKTYAMTNIAWDDSTRKFYAENAPRGMEFGNLRTLLGMPCAPGRRLSAMRLRQIRGAVAYLLGIPSSMLFWVFP